MKRGILFVLMSVALLACDTVEPYPDIARRLENYPEYTVILNDYYTSGNLFPSYFHEYKVILGEEQPGRDDLRYIEDLSTATRVDRETYQQYAPYLGMAILGKEPDGDVIQTPFPAGYQYVGNPEYGRWVRDDDGNEFWEFAGSYLILRTIFDTFDGPRVYRRDWDGYTRSLQRQQPYFGSGNRYGTSGSLTKQTNPTFFQRQQQRIAASRQSFSQRVDSRISRTSGSSFRSRSSFSFGGK